MMKTMALLLAMWLVQAGMFNVASAQEGSAAVKEKGSEDVLEKTAARLNGVRDARRLPLAERQQLLGDIKAMVDRAHAERAALSEKHVKKVLFCLDHLHLNDTELQEAQDSLRQQIVLECFASAPMLSIATEKELIQELLWNIDGAGKKPVGKQWQALRNEGVERRLQFWRRVNNEIDPTFDVNDPNQMPVLNVAPPDGIGIPGMAPEVIADPIERARYEAAIDENNRKFVRADRELELLQIRDQYPRHLKMEISDVYGLPPVTQDDREVFKAYLRIYVSDEKLRKELFEIAEGASKGKRYSEPTRPAPMEPIILPPLVPVPGSGSKK